MDVETAFEHSTASADAPPAYSSAGETLPSYRPPTSYKVGTRTLTRPLVQIPEVKAHLCLLRAFRDLRMLVEDGQIAEWPAAARMFAPSARWAWFVGLAVERFQRWAATAAPCGSLDGWIAREMPPVDVLMVWHTYVLSPMWYAEDTARVNILGALRTMDGYLLAALVKLGDISIYEPSSQRRDSWLKSCGTPFDPVASAAVMLDRTIVCPRCLASFAVPFIASDGTGYLQPRFAAACPACGLAATKDSLAVLKFARDVTLDPRSPDDRKHFGYGVYLAGTLRTTTDPTDETAAAALKVKLHGVFKPPENVGTRDEWAKAIAENAQYSMDNIRNLVVFVAGLWRSKKVLEAYTDDRPFSVDLVEAILRQCYFIEKMVELGWTAPRALGDLHGEAVLQHAIVRYHAFLDLTSSAPEMFFVPTLDIDLIWHTHQMKCEIYHRDCGQLIKRYLDHEDRVEISRLATSFDATCSAWQERFGVQYTFCGCPLAESTVAQRFAQLKHRLSGSTPPALSPPQRADGRLATHASEHSSMSLAPLGKSYVALEDAKRHLRMGRLAHYRQDGDTSALGIHGGHQPAFLYPASFSARPVN
ncbi:hypothetical protein PsYK624_142970 [Phanerochaete sordida]|uniref:Uncharacterized protein n=1 Tax=Phanerochaete sordida TaxID=48140 RepID=A0A9P3GMH2_9APHY|nr:hypothetical protein PsYK624_142970 [Phanerochaete sordida]